MGTPRITYQPTGELTRTINVPWEMSRFDPRRVPDARRVEAGGVQITHRGFAYDLVRLAIPKMTWDASFFEAMIAFWAWVGQGGKFGFTLDSSNGAFSVLTGSEAKGSTVIDLESPVPDPPGFGSFNANRWYRLFRADGTAEEYVFANSIGFGPLSLNLTTGIVNSYSADDLCSDADTFFNCVALSSETPVQRIDNVMKFEMVFRSNQDLAGGVVG